jgi:hypothetical protein
MVDRYNALYGGGRNVNTNTNMNNIVVNIPSQGQNNNPVFINNYKKWQN